MCLSGRVWGRGLLKGAGPPRVQSRPRSRRQAAQFQQPNFSSHVLGNALAVAPAQAPNSQPAPSPFPLLPTQHPPTKSRLASTASRVMERSAAESSSWEGRTRVACHRRWMAAVCVASLIGQVPPPIGSTPLMREHHDALTRLSFPRTLQAAHPTLIPHRRLHPRRIRPAPAAPSDPLPRGMAERASHPNRATSSC